MLELSGPARCTVQRFPFDDADDLLDACARLRQEGIVLKRLDARYMPVSGLTRGARRNRRLAYEPWSASVGCAVLAIAASTLGD